MCVRHETSLTTSFPLDSNPWFLWSWHLHFFEDDRLFWSQVVEIVPGLLSYRKLKDSPFKGILFVISVFGMDCSFSSLVGVIFIEVHKNSQNSVDEICHFLKWFHNLLCNIFRIFCIFTLGSKLRCNIKLL